MRLLVFAMLIAASFETSAWAGAIDPSPQLFSTRPIHDPWRVSWATPDDQSAPATPHPFRSLAFASALLPQDAQPVHAAAIEHSSAFRTRSKIHKMASFATLPLFAVEVALGQSLFNNATNSNGTRSAHGIVGAGIMGLFAVNTVTGAWNMFGEDRRDPKGRTLRLVHGLLMMAADVGFVATSMSGPHSGGRNALTFATNEVTHRNLAVASFSVGTVGYLLMLFGNH